MTNHVRASSIIFFVSIVHVSCQAMQGGGLKVKRVILDRANHPIISVAGRRITVERPASPSVNPEKYCDLIKKAVLYATVCGRENNLPVRSASVGLPEHQESPCEIERSASPWQLDFGTTMVPVMSSNLGRNWSPKLSELMEAILKEKRIKSLSITGDKMENSVGVIASLVAPLLQDDNMERLDIEYMRQQNY